MTKETVWGSLALSFISISYLTSLDETDKRLNFIIIKADDAAWDVNGPYGNTKIKTPDKNLLAEQGLIFTNAFLSTSSCSPSRASILTGRYPHSTGAAELHMPLPAHQLLFAGELQKAGYYTAAAGKYHIGPHRLKNCTM